MHDLLLERPDNVRGPFGTYVNHDVFHIAERLKELDPHLVIEAHEPKHFGPKTWNFTIAELIPGGEKLVMRVEQLDARIIERCRYILSVPFEQRYAEMEKEEAKWEAQEWDRQKEEAYERIGGPMNILLEQCGFSQRPKSYAKRGVTHAPRRRSR